MPDVTISLLKLAVIVYATGTIWIRHKERCNDTGQVASNYRRKQVVNILSCMKSEWTTEEHSLPYREWQKWFGVARDWYLES
jgi:hypothetical protein